MSECILDASALLAYFYDENGADRVEQALSCYTCIGSINWAEVLSKVNDKGQSPEALVETLINQGLIGNSLVILPTTDVDALLIAQLRPETRQLGLSLGDRACLALGLRLKIPILTADQIWSNVSLDLSIQIIC